MKKMLNKIILLTLTICCFGAVLLNAQNDHAVGDAADKPEKGTGFYTNPEYNFERLSVEHGLSQSSIHCMAQDRYGYMWFGTENGLNRYDGYNFEVLKNEPGNLNSLSSNYIKSIYAAQTGILWIGTNNGGLNKYDPLEQKFTCYRADPKDSSSISHDKITCICEDQSGAIWIGTEEGLNRLDPQSDKITHFYHMPNNANSLSHNRINTVCEDESGIIWVGTGGGGLNRFDLTSQQWTHYNTDADYPNKLYSDYISVFCQVGENQYWIGTVDQGLIKFEFDSKNAPVFTQYEHTADNPNSLSSNMVHAVYPSHSGNLWIATKLGGLTYFDVENESYGKYAFDSKNDNGLSSNDILSLHLDKSGILWIGTYGGGINKLKLTQNKFIHYKNSPHNPNSLDDNLVWTIYEDSDGELWVGTHEGGLNRLNSSRNNWTHYVMERSNPFSIQCNWVRYFCEDKTGKFWMIAGFSGLSMFDKKTNKFSNYIYDPENPNSLNSDVLTCIYEDSKDNLWIGTIGGGLNRLDRTTDNFIHFVNEPDNSRSISHNHVSAIYEDRHGYLWIGTFGGGLNRYDQTRNEFRHYMASPNDSICLRDYRISLILETEAGELWVGSRGGGLCRYNSQLDKFERFCNDSENSGSLSSDFIFQIYEDRVGELWIATLGGGLNKFDRVQKKFIHYSEPEGLCDNAVYNIIEDDSGYLWLSTNNGLSRFEPKTETFINYSVADGLQCAEFNENSCFKSRTGEIFFGGINGFNSFIPKEIKKNPYVPPVTISFHKFNKPTGLEFFQPKANQLELSYKDYFFSFEFAALDYTAPEKNLYAYKMEGLDDDWIYTDASRRFASYTTLAPGEYLFRVKASNNDAVWNEKGVSVNVIITPPFWQTWWFRGLVVAFVLLLAFSGYKSRIRKIEARKEMLEIRVREKTLAAKELENALQEVEQLKNRLQAENLYLQDEIKIKLDFENIITCSDSMKNVLGMIKQVAKTDSTVLILGESGTGKELLARAVHELSSRNHRPLVKVNCAALPANLIESELFGHEKGAFTGAISRKIGRFELADAGTIFLDEIGDLPLELQSKLLRVIQEGEFERLGNSHTIKVDVRIIAATNRNLEHEVAKGSFREDLYYRLNVFPVRIPPLRKRKSDIPLLVRHFIKKFSQKIGKTIEIIPKDVLDTLESYHWPGNVRELENIIERAVIISRANKLSLGSWFNHNLNSNGAAPLRTLEENEKHHIIRALEITGWRVSGDKGAAKILDVNPKTLASKIYKFEIKRNGTGAFSDISENSDISEEKLVS